jgi:hypothetical protein
MEETYYAAAYWLARSESAEACAQRAERFFHFLSRCDPAWTHWYEPADSFEEARQRRFTTDATNFQALYARKENGFNHHFSFGLWTGDNLQQTSSIDGRCGSPSHLVASCCVLQPHHQGPVADRVLTASVMSSVLRAMVLSWEPEWAVATSHQHRERVVKGFPHAGTFVGWVMYFSRLRGTVPPLPAPVRIEPMEDKGTLVILTPERFTVANPEHLALAARVHELLDRARLLRKLEPWPGA